MTTQQILGEAYNKLETILSSYVATDSTLMSATKALQLIQDAMAALGQQTEKIRKQLEAHESISLPELVVLRNDKAMLRQFETQIDLALQEEAKTAQSLIEEIIRI